MLNFPSNPVEDQPATINGKSYVYKAGRWLSLATAMLINGNLETRLSALEATAAREKDKRIGSFFFHSAASAPNDALVADGSAVSRTTYAALFAKIGTVFGAGDGSSTFNLPDLRGVVPRGLDLGKGYDSGRTLGSYQADDNKSHNHTASTESAGNHGHTIHGYVSSSTFKYEGGGGLADVGIPYKADSASAVVAGGAHTHSVTVDANGETEARMKNIALLPCIWYA